ncbi:MAG: hypothetical protein ACRDY4_06945 [Acidimicrobiia bacterium]
MATRNLYLHEYVDIVGEGAMRYMEHTVAFDADAAADRGLALVGTWYTMGSTGRWPQVVNLWECVDGWTGWRRLMESTNLRRTQNAALNEWWREALQTRSGGFDRLLGAAPGCPSLAELRAAGTTGSVFVHELSQVRPGAALDYLAAAREDWQPVAGDYGHTLVGLYEALLTDTEVLTIWATDPAGHEALGRATDDGTDERIPRWRGRAREFLTRWREELMTPHPTAPLSRGDSL